MRRWEYIEKCIFVDKYLKEHNPSLLEKIFKEIECINTFPNEHDISILKRIIYNYNFSKQFNLYFIASFIYIYQKPILLIEGISLKRGLRANLSYYLDTMGEATSRLIPQVKLYYHHVPTFKANVLKIVKEFSEEKIKSQ